MDGYKQCVLTSGSMRTVGWVETKFAREGLKVTLDEEEKLAKQQKYGNVHVWTITTVFQFELSAEALKEKQLNDRKSFASIERRK